MAIGQYFRFNYYQKEIEKPEFCSECRCKRILTACYGDLPVQRINRKSNLSHRYVYMCSNCGEVFGMVKQGIEPSVYLQDFRQKDCGEKYQMLSGVER